MAALTGKAALVTGGSRGIGRGIALEMARAGADIAIGYRRDGEAARSCVAEAEALGRRAFAFVVDVRDGEAVHSMMRDAHDALGRLDCVVANAGVPSRFEELQDVDPGYWDRVIQINLYGVFHTLHAAVPILREQGAGALLTISSVGADMCGAKGSPYVAAKAGVNAMTKVVARENARHGVRANIISPGLVQTDIADGMKDVHGDALEKSIPLGRIGTSEEIGKLAVYLASDDASWITGKNFRIDGGAW